MRGSENSSFPMNGWNEYRANGNGGRFELLVAESFIALNSGIKMIVRGQNEILDIVGRNTSGIDLLARGQGKILDMVERNSRKIDQLDYRLSSMESKVNSIDKRLSSVEGKING